MESSMKCAARWLHVAASALAAVLILAPAAGAETLRCKGDLVFADSLARAATLYVDVEQGLVTTPSCHKYPELAGFCAGTVLRASNHRFVFGTAVSAENSKIRIELVRTNNAVSTDTVLTRWPRVLFLGRCEPMPNAARHRRAS
jgi:hypothetical protein